MLPSIELDSDLVTLVDDATPESVVSMVNEAELVRRLQRGDRTAFEPLYSSYVEAASHTAYLITQSHATAEDAVHDAFVEVLRNINTLRDVHHFLPWFYRVSECTSLLVLARPF